MKEAMEDLAESVQKLNQIEIQVLVDEDFESLLQDKKKELMLYRIVQEQLNNIFKYAQASEVTIHLKQQGRNLNLFIRDNGIGFDIHQQGTGIGLKNINSRVHFYWVKWILFQLLVKAVRWRFLFSGNKRNTISITVCPTAGFDINNKHLSKTII